MAMRPVNGVDLTLQPVGFLFPIYPSRIFVNLYLDIFVSTTIEGGDRLLPAIDGPRDVHS